MLLPPYDDLLNQRLRALILEPGDVLVDHIELELVLTRRSRRPDRDVELDGLSRADGAVHVAVAIVVDPARASSVEELHAELHAALIVAAEDPRPRALVGGAHLDVHPLSGRDFGGKPRRRHRGSVDVRDVELARPALERCPVGARSRGPAILVVLIEDARDLRCRSAGEVAVPEAQLGARFFEWGTTFRHARDDAREAGTVGPGAAVDENGLGKTLDIVDERDQVGTRRKPLGNQIEAAKIDSVPLGDLELAAIPFAIFLLSPQVHDGLELVSKDALLELLGRELAASVHALGNDGAKVVVEKRGPEHDEAQDTEAEKRSREGLHRSCVIVRGVFSGVAGDAVRGAPRPEGPRTRAPFAPPHFEASGLRGSCRRAPRKSLGTAAGNRSPEEELHQVSRFLSPQARGREEEDSRQSHVVVSRPNVAEESTPVTKLARKLRTVEYFTLAFGSMVGTGWLIVIDDWLTRGGPLGGILGFLVGSLLLVPIRLTYGRLVAGLPDAGGEAAYTERVFPRAVSFVTGWFVVLAYLIVCPWEAVAIGKLLSRVAPVLDSVELYRFGGQPVFLYRLLLGLARGAFICYLNYRGIRSSATFQNVCTFGLLAVFAIFSALGLLRGDVSNLTPLFSHPGTGGALVSVLLVLQIVPYFMTGFA